MGGDLMTKREANMMEIAEMMNADEKAADTILAVMTAFTTGYELGRSSSVRVETSED